MAIIPPAKANDITNITASIAANIAATYTTGVTLSYAATHAADIAAAISCKCSIAILTADVNATSVLHSQHFIAAFHRSNNCSNLHHNFHSPSYPPTNAI